VTKCTNVTKLLINVFRHLAVKQGQNTSILLAEYVSWRNITGKVGVKDYVAITIGRSFLFGAVSW